MYSWLEPLVFLGWRKKTIEQEDLYELPDDHKAQNLYKQFDRYNYVYI